MNNETKAIILARVNEVTGINPRSGLAYALEHFSIIARIGIGVSRREITRVTRELSPFVHSWSTFHRYAGVAKNFVRYCKSRRINKLHKVDKNTVEAFLLAKIDKGRRVSTLETNMCALQKFFGACGRPDLAKFLADNYCTFKERARSGSSIHSFDDPELLIKTLEQKRELSAVIAEIILLTGARIHEVRTMRIEGADIIIGKGKGGKKRVLDFSFRQDHLERVTTLTARLDDLLEGIDWQEYCQKKNGKYQAHVKLAACELEDEYQGAHGLRANYARNLRGILEGMGLEREEMEAIITRDLGHERRSMARHYLAV